MSVDGPHNIRDEVLRSDEMAQHHSQGAACSLRAYIAVSPDTLQPFWLYSSLER